MLTLCRQFDLKKISWKYEIKHSMKIHTRSLFSKQSVHQTVKHKCVDV